ncbi:MAG TPA: response regulator transcription factor [Nitrospira sp.]|nr:response regulator transcription factor [Nitrospira sp.]
MQAGKEYGQHTLNAVIQVLLVDDHALIRRGLRAILESYCDVQVVGEVDDGRQAIEAVKALRPQLVVMDINMPVMDGIEATARIKHEYPDTIVVGLSISASKENREAILKAGAIELLAKEAALEQLHDTIVRAFRASKMEGRLCSAMDETV